MNSSLQPSINNTAVGQMPLFPDIGVIGFVPEEWGGLWMPRHQVLTRLAKYFHVMWAEPARGWRELWFPGKEELAQTYPEARFPPGFSRYRPGRWHPQLYRPAALASWIAIQRVRHIVTALRNRGCSSIVLYLWRPEFSYALDTEAYDLSCYHIDDEYSFSPSEMPLDDREVALIRRVDQVFIHSPALLERKGHLNPHTLFVPNGVSYEAFAAPQKEPADLLDIPHPRLGYIGNIKTQLDFRLLRDLAIRRPEWSMVFVGPTGYLGEDAPVWEQLSALPNVYCVGNKPVEIVGAYPQHMDVCLLPYVRNDYTKYIYPLKLHEYLAGGRPVVGTPIQSLESFKDVIQLAVTVEEWDTAIKESLLPASMSLSAVENRRMIAHAFDWNMLVRRVAQAICQGLGPEQEQRFAGFVPSDDR